MFAPPLALTAVLHMEQQTPRSLDMIRQRLSTDLTSVAARTGYAIDRHPVHIVEKPRLGTDSLIIVAVICGDPTRDAQLLGGVLDGAAHELTLTDGWKPLDVVAVEHGARTFIYELLGVRLSTGQWTYRFHSEIPDPAQPEGDHRA